MKTVYDPACGHVRGFCECSFDTYPVGEFEALERRLVLAEKALDALGPPENFDFLMVPDWAEVKRRIEAWWAEASA